LIYVVKLYLGQYQVHARTTGSLTIKYGNLLFPSTNYTPFLARLQTYLGRKLTCCAVSRRFYLSRLQITSVTDYFYFIYLAP